MGCQVSPSKCAQNLNKNNSIPHTLCYHVFLALQSPQAVKKEKQDNRSISDLDAKQLCAVIREERAEELARAGMGTNAARN